MKKFLWASLLALPLLALTARPAAAWGNGQGNSCTFGVKLSLGFSWSGNFCGCGNGPLYDYSSHFGYPPYLGGCGSPYGGAPVGGMPCADGSCGGPPSTSYYGGSAPQTGYAGYGYGYGWAGPVPSYWYGQ